MDSLGYALQTQTLQERSESPPKEGNGPRKPGQRFLTNTLFWPFVVLSSQHLELYNKSMERVRALGEAQYPSVWILHLV
jgi:hypothetical protein